MVTEYDDRFYDVIRDGAQRSAKVVAPMVEVLTGRVTVADIGCGQGWWALEFARLGCTAYGADGSYVDPFIDPFYATDLAEPFDLPPADLAVCLEVAEHLPPARAGSFIDDLCRIAPIVLFSAAIPGQGGVDHLNEQWPTYWVAHFRRNGLVVTDKLRWSIWNDDRVEPWYRQNLLLAFKPAAMPALFPPPPVRDVVHPIYWRDRGHGGW